jgi:signal transduction histidine kinase
VDGERDELAHGMHPSLITRLGLADAIRSLASRSSVPVVVTELPERRLDGAVEADAYYVLAEAVTNAHRHAGASLILLSAGISGDVLRIEVADDGVGGASLASGSGLKGLLERVDALGGSLSIQSPVGRGTRIVARLPTTPARQE